jgi:hypothetical protein
MQQLKVFISSTCYDLKQIRKDLSEFISTLGYQPIMSELDPFPVDPNVDTISNCIRNVEVADLFVLIIGGRYGYVLDNGKSITNMEYIYARKKGIPVFVFINREVVNGLSIYKDNPNANFKSLVDDTKVFDFVNDVRTVNQHWCYDFEHAQDITANLKIRFSHLFSDALTIRSRMKTDDQEELWKVISPKATAIALRKEDCYELKFFRQVLIDELKNYQNIRFDQQYEVFLGYSNNISSCKETKEFLSHALHDVQLIVESAGNIVNKAFKHFWGVPGVPADLYGLYYVANRLAKVYEEMLIWSKKIRNTQVPEYFENTKMLTADYNKASSESIWNYPSQIQNAIDQINLAPKGEGVINIKVDLNFNTDPDLLSKHHGEITRLTKFFRDNPHLYN